MADDIAAIADAVKRGDDKGATLRIGKVTEVEAATGRVRLDITGEVWLQTDAESSFEIGERAYAFMQGPTGVVGGKLASGSTATPVGSITAYAGGSTTIPVGWALCNGQALSRTAYPLLFTRLGTTYGAGDGTTTFNVPQLEGRFPLGSNGTWARNATGGSERVTLSTAEMPSHTHGSSGSHTHSYAAPGTDNVVDGTGDVVSSEIWDQSRTTGGGTHEHTSVGSGSSHQNMPPYVAVHYIIRLT